MSDKKKVGPFVRNGFILGLFFPLLAVSICMFMLTPEDYPFSLLTLHQDFPLLWIINCAPFVLAFMAYFVGINIVKLDIRFYKQVTKVNDELIINNAQLEILNDEKEVLLKEIHHRVKNNLQIITSLLSLQSSFIEDDQSKALFRYSQFRINSMAMIHEMLYESKDISKINYGTYADKLISGLILSMKGSENNVQLDVDIPEIDLNIDTAIPLGLLINEIITNALKYGLKGNNDGAVYIAITKIKHNNYKMLIGDNGEGFSDDTNFRNSKSLGLMLIHKLTLQLNGNIEKDNSKKGTNYIVYFQEIHQIS